MLFKSEFVCRYLNPTHEHTFYKMKNCIFLSQARIKLKFPMTRYYQCLTEVVCRWHRITVEIRSHFQHGILHSHII